MKKSTTDILAIIPARYGSTRFPGKPLAMLAGKPMLQHVYEHANEVFSHLYVATDDERIASSVRAWGGKVVLTSPHHPSGTNRCAEALQIIERLTERTFNWVVNIQGDEPFISAKQLEPIVAATRTANAEILTLAHALPPHTPMAEVDNPNRVKLIMNPQGGVIYFSRATIPYLRGIDRSEWLKHHTYYLHIGLYAYRRHTLTQIAALPPTPLEQAETLEQLRWMEAGMTIEALITDATPVSIDTPEDLRQANSINPKFP